MLSSVDLPLPEAPEQHDELAAPDVEVDVAQRVHLDLADAVGLGQRARAEDGEGWQVGHGAMLPAHCRLDREIGQTG